MCDLLTSVDKNLLTAGVDEVGRGPLVGDVVTAAVILDPQQPITGLHDSKKLSEKKRLALSEQIKNKALCWAIGRASPTEIDEMNILQATMLAMHRAVNALSIEPQYVMVDGNRLPHWPYASEAVVKGDGLIPCISAASILAKVERDHDMTELDKDYPDYGFAQHKGYPTAAHLNKLHSLPVLSCYRKSFKPVAQALLAKTNALN